MGADPRREPYRLSDDDLQVFIRDTGFVTCDDAWHEPSGPVMVRADERGGDSTRRPPH